MENFKNQQSAHIKTTSANNQKIWSNHPPSLQLSPYASQIESPPSTAALERMELSGSVSLSPPIRLTKSSSSEPPTSPSMMEAETSSEETKLPSSQHDLTQKDPFLKAHHLQQITRHPGPQNQELQKDPQTSEMLIKTTLSIASKSSEPSFCPTSPPTSPTTIQKMSIVDQLEQLIAEDFDSHRVLACNVNGPRSLQSHTPPSPTMSPSNLSNYYDAEEGDLTPPPLSPSSSPSPPPTFDSLPDATWNLEQLPVQSPTPSSTLFPSPSSSTTTIDLPWATDASYAPPLSISNVHWDIPSRQNHPQLNAMLTYVSAEKVPDYIALCFLSRCTPANDFTRLCQYLCMDRAAQFLSGNIQSVDFNKSDLEDLFCNLEWRMGAKTTKNEFYETCGHPPPFLPMQEACNKEFRRLNNEWT